MEMYFGDTLAIEWEGCPELFEDLDQNEEFINHRKEIQQITRDHLNKDNFLKSLTRTDVLPRTHSYTLDNQLIEFT